MYIKKPFEQDEVVEKAPSDRRGIKRRHLIYYLRVWDKASDRVLGHVVDITTEGMMLISEQPIPLQKSFELEVRWQDADKGEQRLPFLAESRWSDNDVNPAFYDVGFKLLEDSKKVLDPIAELIENYGFSD